MDEFELRYKTVNTISTNDLENERNDFCDYFLKSEQITCKMLYIEGCFRKNRSNPFWGDVLFHRNANEIFVILIGYGKLHPNVNYENRHVFFLSASETLCKISFYSVTILRRLCCIMYIWHEVPA